MGLTDQKATTIMMEGSTATNRMVGTMMTWSYFQCLWKDSHLASKEWKSSKRWFEYIWSITQTVSVMFSDVRPKQKKKKKKKSPFSLGGVWSSSISSLCLSSYMSLLFLSFALVAVVMKAHWEVSTDVVYPSPDLKSTQVLFLGKEPSFSELWTINIINSFKKI